MKKILLIAIATIILVGCGNKQLSDNFEKKSKCVGLGEQYYSNYLETQKHNEMFSFDLFDMNHEVAYSSELDTCLLYVGTKFKDVNGHIGQNWNKFIYDLLNNEYLYLMSYGSDNNQEVVLFNPESKAPSSFATDKEFMEKKNELFK
jgi:hypothetical protein